MSEKREGFSFIIMLSSILCLFLDIAHFSGSYTHVRLPIYVPQLLKKSYLVQGRAKLFVISITQHLLPDPSYRVPVRVIFVPLFLCTMKLGS